MLSYPANLHHWIVQLAPDSQSQTIQTIQWHSWVWWPYQHLGDSQPDHEYSLGKSDMSHVRSDMAYSYMHH